MKNFFVPVIAILALVLGACNKNQKVVNALDGDWKITSQVINGVPADPKFYNTIVFSFEKCRSRRGACFGEMDLGTVHQDSTILDFAYELFSYEISSKGEKIVITTRFLGDDSESITGDILEYSDSKLVFQVDKFWEVDENKTIVVTTMEKI